MKVDNELANELLVAARKGQRIPEFMDAVSGVKNYRLDNHKRQGVIRSRFAKEIISDQFLLDIDEIISEFWNGVFEKIDKAVLHGEVVVVSAPGKKKVRRPTKNNPIHWLREHGVWAVRNFITSLYRKNLEQHCTSCGYKTSVKNKKECPKCAGVMTTMYKFSHDTDMMPGGYDQDIVEEADQGRSIDRLLGDFADAVLGEGTRAYQVLKIMTEPEASREMCNACGLCDAKTFDIDSCTNYNANIGKFLGVNKTMIANKVRRIRKALPEWLQYHGSHEARNLLEVIPRKYKSLQVID